MSGSKTTEMRTSRITIRHNHLTAHILGKTPHHGVISLFEGEPADALVELCTGKYDAYKAFATTLPQETIVGWDKEYLYCIDGEYDLPMMCGDHIFIEPKKPGSDGINTLVIPNDVRCHRC